MTILMNYDLYSWTNIISKNYNFPLKLIKVIKIQLRIS